MRHFIYSFVSSQSRRLSVSKVAVNRFARLLAIALVLISNFGASVFSASAQTRSSADAGAGQPANSPAQLLARQEQRPVFSRPEPKLVTRPTQATIQASPTPIKNAAKKTSAMFIQNVGQFDSQELFQVQGGQENMYLAPSSIWITKIDPASLQQHLQHEKSNAGSGGKSQPGATPGNMPTPTGNPDSGDMISGVNLQISFEDANPNSQVEGFKPAETKMSFFAGKSLQGGHADVPVWNGVRYVDFYPGYNLELSGTPGKWNWQLVRTSDSAAQGHKSVNLKLRIDGAQSLALEGNLLRIKTQAGDVKLPLPQVVGAGAQPDFKGARIEGNQVILPVTVPAWDAPTALPTLTPAPQDNSSATPTPPTPEDNPSATSTTPAPQDNPGATPTPPTPQDNPSVTPTTPAPQDNPSATPTSSVVDAPIALVKNHADSAFADSGQVGDAGPASRAANQAGQEYSSHFGGECGETSWDIAVDSSGATYVVGATCSTTFPTTPGAFQTSLVGGGDVFITKLDPTGSTLVFSTYLGGAASDEGLGIAVDSGGAVYVVGRTNSTNFPTTSGAYDRTNSGNKAFVSKLSADGASLVYSTYLGDGGQGFGIAVNSSGEAYVTGQGTSTFPTTAGAYDRSYNGGFFDGFVTRLNAAGSGLVFSTFLGGSADDCEIGYDVRECSIALGPDGSVYIGGRTFSSNFPTTSGAYKTTGSGANSFVTRLNSNGGSLIYSTLIGSDNSTYVSLAVDADGYAYLAGTTDSSSFPTTVGAFDRTYNGGLSDVYLTKVKPDGSGLVYSTYFGTTGDDVVRNLAVTADKQAAIIGDTNSNAFPVGTDGFQPAYGGGTGDAFITRFTADGAGPSYSTYLGGAGGELGLGVAVSGNNIYATGYTTSPDLPTTPGSYQTTLGNVFVANLYSTGSTVLPNMAAFTCNCADSNVSSVDGTQINRNDPINTRTGGETEQATDLSLPTSAGSLSFERVYSSLATDLYATTLGFGWTHNLDSRLIFPTDPGGVDGLVLLKAHSANLYQFIINSNGTYSPGAGVMGNLSCAGTTCTLALPSQETYTFLNHKLQTWADGKGHSWAYAYNGSGQLSSVTDDTGTRYLSLAYNGQGRIASVSDSSSPSRTVTFGYDVTTGDLTSVIDLDGTWHYEYVSHRLTRVLDPANQVIMRTVYDSQGRAIQQYDGKDKLMVQVTYNADGTATFTDANGGVSTYTFDTRNTVKNHTAPLTSASSKTYDPNFRPSSITNPGQPATLLTWSADGADLQHIVDPAGS